MIEKREEFLKKYLSIEDKIKRKNYVRIRKYMASHQELRLLHVSKQRAKANDIEHTLVVEDIVIPERCPYLDIPITNVYGAGRVFSNASIDRMDAKKGYTKDNIQILSDLANRMKQNATPEQLIVFAKNVLRIHARD